MADVTSSPTAPALPTRTGDAPAREPLVKPWMRYSGGRLLQGLFVIFGAVTISFILVNMIGDPATVLVGGQLSREQVDNLSHILGYDRPLPERYVAYILGLLRGDLGVSLRYGTSVLDLVLAALPATLLIVIGAMSLACVIAIPAAVFSVLRRETLADRASRRFFIVLQAIPEFWAALMLAMVFAVGLRWLPSMGFDSPQSLILPVLVIGLPLISSLVRLLRATLLDTLNSDFTLAVRAKGIPEREIVIRHGLPNVMAPFLTLLALHLGWLIGGTLIIETIFVWPGVGTLLTNAVKVRDLPVIQGVVVLIAVAVVVLNLVVDLLVMVIDPRIRTGRR
ncbi:MAG: ABC transporter permease [Chloroflexota bacterium]